MTYLQRTVKYFFQEEFLLLIVVVVGFWLLAFGIYFICGSAAARGRVRITAAVSSNI
jgi:hypothetical protein